MDNEVSERNSLDITPARPPLTCADLPPLEGHLGQAPEDFLVDEIPAYQPSGSGSHLYVRVRKRLLNTQDLVQIIAKAANVPVSEVGSAGMKDKHAITTQWLSVPAQCRPLAEWELPSGVEVLEDGLHNNKLRTGHLQGNRFTLRLVDLGADDHSRFVAIWNRVQCGIYNGYGAQRFGYGGQNLERALRWLAGEFELRGPKARFQRKLFPSVVQADVFNRYLIARLARSLEQPILGEIVRISGSGSRFIVKDTSAELPRWQSRAIVPMGPIVGGKMHPKFESDAQALELEALKQVCNTEIQQERLRSEAPGTHRDLLVYLEDPVFETVEGADARSHALVMKFTLPAGAYATEVLREFTDPR